MINIQKKYIYKKIKNKLSFSLQDQTADFYMGEGLF